MVTSRVLAHPRRSKIEPGEDGGSAASLGVLSWNKYNINIMKNSTVLILFTNIIKNSIITCSPNVPAYSYEYLSLSLCRSVLSAGQTPPTLLFWKNEPVTKRMTILKKWACNTKHHQPFQISLVKSHFPNERH